MLSGRCEMEFSVADSIAKVAVGSMGTGEGGGEAAG